MRTILTTAASCIVVTLAFSLSPFADSGGDQYAPPIPVQTQVPWYPWNSVASGMVSLWVHVQEDGKVKDVEILKSIPSLDEPSLRAARRWSFEPARIGSGAVESYTILNFVYGLDRKPTKYKVHRPELTRTWMNSLFPLEVYPINLPAPPTFTVIASVDYDGKVSSVAAAGVSLQEELLDLISKNWVFVPRHRDLKPTSSRVAITFSYVPIPVSNSF